MANAGFCGSALTLATASSRVPSALGLAGLSKPTWLSLSCRNVRLLVCCAACCACASPIMPSAWGTPPEIVHNTPVPAQVIHSRTLRRLTPSSRSDSLIAFLSSQALSPADCGFSASEEVIAAGHNLFPGVHIGVSILVWSSGTERCYTDRSFEHDFSPAADFVEGSCFSQPSLSAGFSGSMLQSTFPSVETRTSWVVASVALLVMAIAFGAPWITVVALKDIAAEVNGERSIPAFASALMWIGSGAGGILMGRVAEHFGIRFTVILGAAMSATGLAISTLGPPWPLYIEHGLFLGFLGIGGINAPFYVYVSRWFDRRRGSALALISSGSYLAGAFWPPIFERATALLGWRDTMLIYAVLEIAIVVPLAAIFFRRPPEVLHAAVASSSTPQHTRVLGWPPNLVFVLMCMAMFLCC